MFSRFFNTEIDEREDIKKAIALLKPQTDKLFAEADRERVEKQRDLLPRLESLQQQRRAEIPPLHAKVQELSEKEEKLRVALQETTRIRCSASCELSQKSWWFDHQKELLQAQIYELASPVIIERQKKWRDLIQEARLQVSTETRTTRRNIFGQASEIVVSNISMINRRVNAITAAIKAAEELKIQPLPESEIIKRLDALEETFPPLTAARETITIPIPDVTELQRVTW